MEGSEKEEDEDDIFHSLANDDQFEVKSALDSFPKQQLSCFDYTLQLVIKDGCGALSKSPVFQHFYTKVLFSKKDRYGSCLNLD